MAWIIQVAIQLILFLILQNSVTVLALFIATAAYFYFYHKSDEHGADSQDTIIFVGIYLLPVLLHLLIVSSGVAQLSAFWVFVSLMGLELCLYWHMFLVLSRL